MCVNHMKTMRGRSKKKRKKSPANIPEVVDVYTLKVKLCRVFYRNLAVRPNGEGAVRIGLKVRLC